MTERTARNARAEAEAVAGTAARTGTQLELRRVLFLVRHGSHRRPRDDLLADTQ